MKPVKKTSEKLHSKNNENYEINDGNETTIVPGRPRRCTREEFDTIWLNSKSLFVLAQNSIKQFLSYTDETDVGFAFFSREGCLLKLVGDDRFLKWAEIKGIEERGLWLESEIGPNPVATGLKTGQPESASGNSRSSGFLSGTAVHFCPVIGKKEMTREMLYGGIAIIGDQRYDSLIWRAPACNVSREISLMLFWFSTVHMITDGLSGYGFISIDQSEGQNRILYANKDIHDVLNIPHTDLFYKKLEDFIEVCPENDAFWELVAASHEVRGAALKIIVMGKPYQVICDVSRFDEERFHVKGTYIQLNTRQRINSLVSRKAGNTARFTFAHIVGRNREFMDVVNHARAAALSDSNILLLGGSGVGKDVIAQAIHNESRRRHGPFVAINCAALPQDLIGSELFGYEGGSFTGSRKGGNIGKFELADKGTIFLDEIGDMQLDLQASLLRVIEQKNFMRIGGSMPIDVDVRIIAATNADLRDKMSRRKFREDLFYRLGIIRLTIPPLSERREDILLLADHFIRIICNRLKKPMAALSRETADFFLNYAWPGNLRELQNLLEGIIQIYDSPVIEYDHVKHYVQDGFLMDNTGCEPTAGSLPGPDSTGNEAWEESGVMTDIRAQVPDSRSLILKSLQENKYNKTETAKALGISRRTLYRRMKEYGL